MIFFEMRFQIAISQNSHLKILAWNVRHIHVVSGRTNIFVLLVCENIESDHVNLGMTVLASLWGRHFDDFTTKISLPSSIEDLISAPKSPSGTLRSSRVLPPSSIMDKKSSSETSKSWKLKKKKIINPQKFLSFLFFCEIFEKNLKFTQLS